MSPSQGSFVPGSQLQPVAFAVHLGPVPLSQQTAYPPVQGAPVASQMQPAAFIAQLGPVPVSQHTAATPPHAGLH